MLDQTITDRAEREAALVELEAKFATMVREGKLDGNLKTGVLEHEAGQLLNPAVLLVFNALNVLMADTEPAGPVPLFVHVRADYQLVVQTAGELYDRGKVSEVYLGGSEGEKRGDTVPGVIFQGYTFWENALMAKGIPQDKIHPTGPVFNTPDEHMEMIKLGQVLRWKELLIIGNPYHMLRIALGNLRFMKQEDFWMKCFFVTPKVSSWQVEVDGPQGTKDGVRYNQLWVELPRVIEYMAKSPRDLLTLSELINYIVFGRDSIEDNKLTLPLS